MITAGIEDEETRRSSAARTVQPHRGMYQSEGICTAIATAVAPEEP